jgi:hypothetical protein
MTTIFEAIKDAELLCGGPGSGRHKEGNKSTPPSFSNKEHMTSAEHKQMAEYHSKQAKNINRSQQRYSHSTLSSHHSNAALFHNVAAKNPSSINEYIAKKETDKAINYDHNKEMADTERAATKTSFNPGGGFYY